MTHPLFHYVRQTIGMIFFQARIKDHYLVPEYNAIFFYKTRDSSLFIVHNVYQNIFRKINDIVSSFWVLSSLCEGMELVTLLAHWLTPPKLSCEPLNFSEEAVFSVVTGVC